MTETQEWATEIIAANVREQRIALRSSPHHMFDMEFDLFGQQAEAATGLLRASSDERLIVPIWHDLEKGAAALSAGTTTIPVDTTIRRFKVGAYAFVIGNDDIHEAVLITAITATDITVDAVINNYAVFWVMPAYLGVIENQTLNLQRTVTDYTVGTATFVIDDTMGVDAAIPSRFQTFNGSYIVTDLALLPNSANEQHQQRRHKLDNVSGKLHYTSPHDYVPSSRGMGWLLNTMADRYEFMKWMYHLKGRQGSFYAPTYTFDYNPLNDIASGDTAVPVQKGLHGELDNDQPDAIVFITTDYQFIPALVDSIDTSSASEDVITLSAGVASAITTASIWMVCKLPRVRFSSDNIVYQYTQGGEVETDMTITRVFE